MAYPSVTFSFANSTTADATQVNQNFTDLINGASDGTKDYSISALTCAGTATLNGHVNLGNSSSDDLTITASLASTLSIKTNQTYNIGSSTLGLNLLYLGSASSKTTAIAGAATTSYTLTLPTTAGTAGYNTVNLGSGSLAFLPPPTTGILNYGLAATVGSNALTIALKGADGNDPSATNPVYIPFRNTTAATGTPLLLAVTGALSVVVSSGSTLGSTSGNANWVYVYAIDSAGTVELAVCGARLVDEGALVTTTAEGGGGAADDKLTLYSTTQRTSVPARLLGRVKSTQATAGTWATAPAEISLAPFGNGSPRSEVNVSVNNGNGSSSTQIKRWTNVNKNVGTAITYSDSSTLGGLFTINEDGVYACTYTDRLSGGLSKVAITVNDSAVTTDVTSLTYANGLRAASSPATNSEYRSVSWIGGLVAGDIVTAHGNAGDNNATVMFSIVQVSK